MRTFLHGPGAPAPGLAVGANLFDGRRIGDRRSMLAAHFGAISSCVLSCRMQPESDAATQFASHPPGRRHAFAKSGIGTVQAQEPSSDRFSVRSARIRVPVAERPRASLNGYAARQSAGSNVARRLREIGAMGRDTALRCPRSAPRADSTHPGYNILQLPYTSRSSIRAEGTRASITNRLKLIQRRHRSRMTLSADAIT